MNNFGSTHHLGFDESLEDNPFADVVSQNNAFASTSFQRHVPQSSLMTSSDQIIASEWDTGSEHDWSSKDETTQYKTTITQGTTNKHADSALQTVEITDNSAEIYLSAQRTRQEEQEKTVRIEAEAKAILEAEEARKTEARLIKAKEIAEREKAAREAEAREAEAREAEAREAEAREAEAREAEARESKAREAETREAEARDAEAREAEESRTKFKQAEAVAGLVHIQEVKTRFANDDQVEEWDDQPSEQSEDEEPDTRQNKETQHTEEEEFDTQSESLEIPKSGIRPYFEVTVEDPQKVGDAINAHIVYKVKTKTNSPVFRSPECVVARRYRDFLWLYNQLTLGNPGVVVPPVPEKHALGRFQDEFVESRRIALERCLRKVVSHPMLYGDPDLKVFLESESFNIEKRQKRAEPETPKLSFMRSFGETISNAASNPFSKFVEVDEWFGSKKDQLDALEVQLKALMKSVESVVKQRKELGIATADFGESMFPLASAELNRNLSTHLTVLGDVQRQMKELHEQQAQHDVLTLEHTIDEYIRIIGSIRLSFNARIKAYQTYQQDDSELQKKKITFEKLKSQSKSKSDRMTLASQEISEMQQRVDERRKDFEDISKLIKSELDRFDKEKVEDFRDSVEKFLCSMIGHQKQVIALWETYFEQTEGLDDDDYDEEFYTEHDENEPSEVAI